MAKKAVGRTKLAAKHARKIAEGQDGSAAAPVVSKDVPRKTKQKVTKKIQFLERVEKSGAGSIKKSKNQKKKKAPLPDLSGISKALEDLLPEVKAQEEKSATVNGTKYKRATARKRLQQSEQERLVAIFASKDFQSDPIGAVGSFLERSVEAMQQCQPKQATAASGSARESAKSKKKNAQR